MADGARRTCRLVVERDFLISQVDPRFCGSFVEHLGRVVYGGILRTYTPSG